MMVAFDTNYLVRHLVGDDRRQARKVEVLIAEEVGADRTILLPDVVICETMWVLESIYKATRSDLLATLKALWEDSAFRFECSERMRVAIDRFADGRADFSDFLVAVVCRQYGCLLKTFDKHLQKDLDAAE